jgi:predicted Zn-dependent protease
VLLLDDRINAFSDGKHIIITNGLIRAVENDNELALVVAHEIEHNVLGHIGKKRRNVPLGSIFDILVLATTGISTGGAFGRLGGAAYSQGFEFEADYARLYIAARAGYDIKGAANFWRRLAAEHPQTIEKGFAASHPSTPERFVAMEKTIQEIKEKQKLGKPLIPETKEKSDSKATGFDETMDPTGQ